MVSIASSLFCVVHLWKIACASPLCEFLRQQRSWCMYIASGRQAMPHGTCRWYYYKYFLNIQLLTSTDKVAARCYSPRYDLVVRQNKYISDDQWFDSPPLLISLLNFEMGFRIKSSHHAFLLLTLLPIPKFIHQDKGLQGVLESCLIHECMDFVVQPLKKAVKIEIMMSDPLGNH